MSKPVLLYYGRHSHGMGAAVRALTIANRLVDRFHVVMLNSGILPPGMSLSPDIDFVQLPPLSLDIDSADVSIDESPTLQNDIALRREMMLEKYSQFKPAVLLIETFPFGRRKLGEELMPVIERARHGISAQPRIICRVVTAGLPLCWINTLMPYLCIPIRASPAWKNSFNPAML